MDSDKNNPEVAPPATSTEAPADALSRTPEDLEKEQADIAAADTSDTNPDPTAGKKLSPVKKFFRKVNLYLLLFVLVAAVAGIVTIVSYLNSQKEAPAPSIEGQNLTTEALKQLANTDTSVGSASRTLTIQGNTIIGGQVLTRGNLNVAGNLQTGGSIQAPSITIADTANLGQTQINSLQVATNTAIQGSTTLRDLNVAGTSSFSGPVTASQITASKLVLSGNAILEIPNHLSFTGPSPARNINTGVLGGGGSASVDGSDTSGTVNVNTGNGPTAGCFVTITFAQRYNKLPHVIVSPVGIAAGQTQYYVNRSPTSFSICTAIPAPANQAFAFDYFVAG